MKYFLLLVFTLTVQGAPTSESNLPQTIFDQKQTGENNIQLHLKDIQIIAILGDEVLGDYDYNYDYSDFTVKPPSGNITLKPPPPPENLNSSISSSSIKPETSTVSSKPESNLTSSTGRSTSEKVDSIPFSTSSPDKIKVQIIEEPIPSIVPSDDMGVSHNPPFNEAINYRRCASGFARDKRGRCRRVRRPGHGHSFDIGRLASSLAARFRGVSSEEEHSRSSKMLNQ